MKQQIRYKSRRKEVIKIKTKTIEQQNRGQIQKKSFFKKINSQ